MELDITTEWFPRQHTLTIEEVCKKLCTNIEKGLTEETVEIRIKKFGYNELSKTEPESIWSKIIGQFEDILVRILLVSAIISFFISYFERHHEHSIPPWVEPCVIFTILILNAIVGVYQDYDAENALEVFILFSLKNLQTEHAIILRNGEWKHLPAKNLVPGDIVSLKQGDKVPADLRLGKLETTTLRLNQSIVTGEANPCQKQIKPVEQEDAILQDKTNTLFSGTTVSNGACIGVVYGTANNTEIGKIHEDLAPPDDQTPLKKRIKEFGDMLAKVIGIICVVIWLMNIMNFFDPVYGNPILGALYFFKIAVSLAVAAIPEGLPAVITTCMALGTREMAKKNAIIRKLPSVETLGCTTVICSDKTGTLTTNNMCVKEFCLFGMSSIKNFVVEGRTYETEGKIEQMNDQESIPEGLRKFVDCCIQCNDSKLLIDRHTKMVMPNGLPTEAALKVLAEKVGNYDKAFVQKKSDYTNEVEKYAEFKKKEYTKLATLEFSRDRKSMSVLCKDTKQDKNVMFIKGAPDYLIRQATKMMDIDGKFQDLNQDKKKELENKLIQYAQKGLRTLAIAMKEDCGKLKDYTGPEHEAHQQLQEIDKYGQFESEPIIIGIVALQDPPRPGVASSIRKCKEAGISIIMITGDIKETAESIAKEIGIVDAQEIEKRSFTGKQFENFTEQEKQDHIINNIMYPSGLIFSRTEPKHKKALVDLLQKNNHIVAMTGDGVNDAPALNLANIGIAMGISGTEVAKDASDMVLADDNFETIVAAVEQGRAIYANMKAFIRYMISSNIGEVVSIFLSSLIGLPDAFNSIQLLWVNLVTDGLPATALSFNPPDPDLMDKPPRPHDEPIVTGWVFFRYMVIGMYVGIVTVGIFVYWYMYYDWAGDGHKLVTFQELKNWSECQNWTNFQVNDFLTYKGLEQDPCGYFTWGFKYQITKTIPSTLSLSTLVIIEMLNAVNALSEDASLFQVGLAGNPWLILAIMMSVALHFMILYVPFFQGVFGTAPLSAKDWSIVLGLSFPVIIIDEILKIGARQRNKSMNKELAKKKKE